MVNNIANIQNEEKGMAGAHFGISSAFARSLLIRKSRLSGLLGTTALVTAALFSGVVVPNSAQAQLVCQNGATSTPGVDAKNPVDEELDGDFVACDAQATGHSDNAFGVDAGTWNSVDNSLTVRGTINAEAIAEDGQTQGADAEVRGIRSLVWSGESNTLINYATIDVMAQAGTSDTDQGTAKAFGIYTEEWNGTAFNSLINYGDINAISSGGYANATGRHTVAYGIRTGHWNGDNNYLENHGDIYFNVTRPDGSFKDSFVSGNGIEVQAMNGVTNFLINYGDIYGRVEAGADAAGRSYAFARGLHLQNDESTGENIYVENWGNMNLLAKGGDNAGGHYYAEVAGILHEGTDPNGATKQFSIQNYADMDLTAISGDTGVGYGEAYAYGLRAERLNASEFALLANHGTIKVLAQDETPSADTRSYGISFDIVGSTGVILNTGVIETLVDSPDGRSVGMGNWNTSNTANFPSVFDGHMRNEGKIVARVSDAGDAFAIRLGEMSDVQDVDPDGLVNVPSVELATQGFLEGRILTQGQTIFVDNAYSGGSVHWTVEDVVGAPVWGTGNGQVFYSADGLSAATFDRSLMLAQNQVTSFASRFGRDAEARQLTMALGQKTELEQETEEAQSTSENAISDLYIASDVWRPWVVASAGLLERDGDDDESSNSATFAGLNAGLVKQVNFGFVQDAALSFSFGLLAGENELNTDHRWLKASESEFDSYFAGVALMDQIGPWQANMDLRFGQTSFEHNRSINNNLVFGGVETANGSQDATWFSASGKLGYDLLSNSKRRLAPFVAFDHVFADFDGYTETGSASNATVASSTSQITRVELGVDASQQFQHGGLLSASIGLFTSFSSGDDTVELTLLGDTQDYIVDLADDTGVRMSLGYDYAISQRISLNSGLNLSRTSSNDTEMAGNLGLNMKF